MATVLKTVGYEGAPWVRIPPLPPTRKVGRVVMQWIANPSLVYRCIGSNPILSAKYAAMMFNGSIRACQA